MITLTNNTGSVSKLGCAVSIDPKNPNAFLYAVPSSTKVIGIITEAVPYRKPCKIATAGERVDVYVAANAVKNDVIRLSKTTDKISLGACGVAKMGDTPYLRIGSALSSGKGLISCILELVYVSAVTDSLGSGAIADGTYTVGLGFSTDGTIVVKDGIIISLIEAT